ncbi:DNA-binding response regulator [Longimycelium tulufanense]|uniref:DNA-binding response regulator n=1 Tax=Longimycelium tulufanense TaxID=907463 RepID=A0A8J3CD70_9PSEU|nr:response regulator transcription factor [Longimycelium tulufanense]GGM56907.1 DNA-binding response regulator [Longimycelium tulufanense]
MTVRILLVDDHPVVRTGLRAMLGTQPDLEVVGEAENGERALALAATLRPDVVLMDLQLGAGIDGVEATRRIVALPEPPRVLVLTTYDTDADILAAVAAGAAGYQLKDTPPEDLHVAIRTAAAGDTALAPRVASRLLGRIRAPGTQLTARELEVLRLVADGLSNREISRTLMLSEATVKTHLVRIYDKLGVDSRTAAVAAAQRSGLIRDR